MASMDKPPLGTSTVKWRFPDIHPEGRKYVAIAAAIALASLFIFDFITWPLVFLAFGVAAFFRDPIRVTPQGEGMLIAPADGLVTMIQPVELPPELRGPQALGDAPIVRISIASSNGMRQRSDHGSARCSARALGAGLRSWTSASCWVMNWPCSPTSASRRFS